MLNAGENIFMQLRKIGKVKALIKAGCDVDKANKDGHTPLFKAAQNGYVEVAQALIEAGCDANKGA